MSVHTVLIIAMAVATFIGFNYALEFGAAFCSRYWTAKKWLPSCVFWGMMLLVMATTAAVDFQMTAWQFCLFFVVMGFPLGIAARSHHLVKRDWDKRDRN